MNPPVRAADFVNSIGVVAPLANTNGADKADAVVSAFAYLGLSNLRTGLTAGLLQAGSVADKLAKAGVHFDVLLGTQKPLADSLALLSGFAASHAGAISAVEGPNEINNWPVSYGGKTGLAAAVSFLDDAVLAMRANPLLPDIALYDLTGAPRSAALAADAANYANIHPYPQDGSQPWDWLQPRIAAHAIGGKGMVISEAGYQTTLGTADWEGVDPATQAKLTLNLLADATLLGVSKTYLYQLFDPAAAAGTSQGGTGLYDAAFHPKPAATAIHNLTAILADDGSSAASFLPNKLDYAISGLPENGHSLLMQKADGTFELMIWAEPDIWDEAADKPIAVAPASVTVTLAGAASGFAVFEPLVSAEAVATAGAGVSITVAVSDHPVIVAITGAVAGAVGEPAHFDPPMTLTGTGLADTLTGGNGDDVLGGLAGADMLSGGGGDDRLIGGAGLDTMRGGEGGDTFVFQTVGDSKPGAPDLILDFSFAQGDRIGLSQIDASARLAGNQAFSLAGDHFTGHAGELIQVTTPGGLLVSGDLNGDRKADFAVLLAGVDHALDGGAFLL